jgi:hypothetical protein
MISSHTDPRQPIARCHWEDISRHPPYRFPALCSHGTHSIHCECGRLRGKAAYAARIRELQASWSGRGDWIAFTSDRAGSADLFPLILLPEKPAVSLQAMAATPDLHGRPMANGYPTCYPNEDSRGQIVTWVLIVGRLTPFCARRADVMALAGFECRVYAKVIRLVPKHPLDS